MSGTVLDGKRISREIQEELRPRIAALAARAGLPAAYPQRVWAEASGLMSYGTSLPNIYRLIGTYTGLILKGEPPSELPVIQPSKFEFVINLKTAKALGLDVPIGLSAAADELTEWVVFAAQHMSPCGTSRRFVVTTINSVAIGGIADLSERLVQTNSVKNDPERPIGVQFCCAATAFPW